jgi:hypothetical protein
MAEDLIELVAPGGCDECNHGTVRYRVDNSGRVRVSHEAAFWLISKAGFTPAPTTPREPDQSGAAVRPRRSSTRGANIEE